MAKLFVCSDGLLSFAYEFSKRSYIIDFKKALSVILGAEFDLSVAQISHLLNVDARTVYKYRTEMQMLYKAGGSPGPRRRKEKLGSGRRKLMTPQEEAEILENFFNGQRKLERLKGSEIQQQLQDYLGHDISLTTVYDILKRHGYKKTKIKYPPSAKKAPAAKAPKAPKAVKSTKAPKAKTTKTPKGFKSARAYRMSKLAKKTRKR
ncbi:MAG: hypothetical protein LBE38_06640 [Deltaproteobacteria bacterium]|jgi:transposase|nr:hypothetical protein [Deltaproteobacteria bacterium]